MTQSEQAVSAPKILLVEDFDDNVVLMKAFLKKSPYLLHVASNGKEGVRMVKCGDYDLVLMDMQMPIMDGYSATQAIRAWEAENGRQPLPIIALTAHTHAEHIQLALDAGCDQHLAKPISRSALLEAIALYDFA